MPIEAAPKRRSALSGFIDALLQCPDDVGEHRFGQAAGVGVEARAVITVGQRPAIAHVVQRSMGERVTAFLEAERR